MIENPVQLVAVPLDDVGEPLSRLVALLRVVRLMLEQLRAQHRHQRQRNHRRDQNRDGQRDRELAEEAADHILHEQERDQDGDQRDGQGDDGEADLAGALERRVQRTLALLYVARDVLDHHDRIVHDETGRDRQRHQREIVQAEVRQVHDREGADKRQGHRQARYERRPGIAQEKVDDEHHQDDGEDQLELDVPNRSPDRGRAVRQDREIDARWKRCLQLRQQGTNAIDDVDDVGARLSLYVDDERRRFVHPSAEFCVLGALDQGSNVAQADRRTVAIGDHDVAVLDRALELIVRVDRV